MRSGRRLAVDVGKVRVGLAISDFHAILASGLATVARAESAEQTAKDILAALADEEVIEIYVGLPLNMSGGETASTADAISIAKALATITPVEVRMIDERLTTVAATAALQSSGKNSKQSRPIIDQVAATVILEQAMDLEKSSGEKPGKSLEQIDG